MTIGESARARGRGRPECGLRCKSEMRRVRACGRCWTCEICGAPVAMSAARSLSGSGSARLQEACSKRGPPAKFYRPWLASAMLAGRLESHVAQATDTQRESSRRRRCAWYNNGKRVQIVPSWRDCSDGEKKDRNDAPLCCQNLIKPLLGCQAAVDVGEHGLGS